MARFFLYSAFPNIARMAKEGAISAGKTSPVAEFPSLNWFSTREDYDPMGLVFTVNKFTGLRELLPFEKSIQTIPMGRIEVDGAKLVPWRELVWKYRPDRASLTNEINYWRSHGGNPVRNWFACDDSIAVSDWLRVEICGPKVIEWKAVSIEQAQELSELIMSQAQKIDPTAN